MFASSSKRAVSSTSATTCLPGLGRADERADDRRLALVGRAVERLLDREHVRVVGRLVDERLDRGREAVVRVLDEHVAARAATAKMSRGSATRAAELGRRHAEPRRRASAPAACSSVSDQRSPRSSRPVDRRRRRTPSGCSSRSSSRAEPLRHRRSSTSSRTASGDRCRPRRSDSSVGEQVVGLVDLDLDVGVARDPERVVLDDLHPREQPVEVARRSPARAARTAGRRRASRKRGRSGGTFTRAKRRSPVCGSRTTTARFSDRSEMYGNGCAGSTASGVSTGKTRSSNTSRSSSRCGRLQVLPVDDPDAARAQQRASPRCLEDLRLPRDELLDARADRVELLARAHAVRRRARHAGGRAAPCRPATRIWKNSSRLRLKIARNSSALERAAADSSSAQREHARVEVEPRQLAVEEPRGEVDRRLLVAVGSRHEARDRLVDGDHAAVPASLRLPRLGLLASTGSSSGGLDAEPGRPAHAGGKPGRNDRPFLHDRVAAVGVTDQRDHLRRLVVGKTSAPAWAMHSRFSFS